MEGGEGGTIRDDMEALDCPLLRGWDGDEALLFTPSEIRTRLLQSLFCRVHSKFREKMDLLHSADLPTPTCDPRLRQLAAFGELLGLCNCDDIDTVSGVAAVSRQQEFYRRLLQLIHSKERTDRAAGEDPALRSHVLASRWFTAELGAGRLLATLASGRPVLLGPPPLPEPRGTRGALQQQEQEERLQELQQQRGALQRQLEEETHALTRLQQRLQQQLQQRLQVAGQFASSQTVPPGRQARAADTAATREGAGEEDEAARERAAMQALSLALRQSQRLAATFRSLSDGELRRPAPPACARPPTAAPARLGVLLHELHANLGLLAQAADAQQQTLSEYNEIHTVLDTRSSQGKALSAEFEKIKRDSISWATALAEEGGL